MPVNYYEENEGPSVPAQEGILDDPDEDTVGWIGTCHFLFGTITSAHNSPAFSISQLRILISTDNHLGYEENDSVRGKSYIQDLV